MIRKQFCISGHNTHVEGRTKTNECCRCAKDKQNTPEMKLYHSEKRREYHLRDLYGISLEEYNTRFDNQKGLCLICYRHQTQLKRRLNVDHCHATGKIRGLLCDDCNKALGNVRDDTTILSRMIDYLGRSHE